MDFTEILLKFKLGYGVDLYLRLVPAAGGGMRESAANRSASGGRGEGKNINLMFIST